MSKKTIVIIGAGLGGLSTAIRLAKSKQHVVVYENQDKAGGKLNEKKINNYRFDLGPSLFTMPQYVDELFELHGKNPRDYFTYEVLSDICTYFYEDGTRFISNANKQKLDNTFVEKLGEKKGAVLSFLKKSAQIYNITAPLFLHYSLHRWNSYAKWSTLLSVLKLPWIKAYQSMHLFHRSAFKSTQAIQYFDRYATYNGSNPYIAPGTLSLIPHVEHHYGAYYPLGGMYKIVEALYRLAVEVGVEFQFNTRVNKIESINERVVGIHVNNEFIPADIIVSNMDVFATYTQLLPAAKAPKRILMQEKSSSALIFYWGINKEFSELSLHNILFSNDYQKEFDTLWNKKAIDEDPTIYINITSKHTPSDAPKHSENWFVMINVPNNQGQNWDQLINDARKNIIKKINRILNTSIENFIEVEHQLNPILIEKNTSSHLGALYGNASNNPMAAFFRHSNDSKIKNLYFVGGSVHPGGGIPLAILSGKIASDLIHTDYSL
jgi:phytoene desaturase